MAKKKQEAQSMPKKDSMKTLGKVFKKNVPWGWLIANFAFSTLMGYFYIELPNITSQIAAGKIFNSALITKFIILSVIQTICYVIAYISSKWVGYVIERNIKKGVWKKLIRIPMKDYDRDTPTSWISRIATDTTLATSFLTSIMEGLLCLVFLGVVFITVFSLSSSIAFAMVSMLPYFFLVGIIPGKLKYKWAAARQEKLAGYTSFVSERISNIRTIKANVMSEQDILAGFQKAEECYKAEKTLAVVEGVCEPFIYLSQIVINLITIVIGGKLVQSGEITNANLMTLYLYGSNFYNFALMTVSMYYTLKLSHGSTKKIGELMYLPDEVKELENAMPTEAADISFRDVSFAYGEDQVLDRVSFTIPGGAVTAIVGPSGSGKSTVLSLIQRLYDPQSGSIALGGTMSGTIHMDGWRKAVGTVQQTCPLLGGTIADNIAYGVDGEVSAEMLAEAAKKAEIYDFVMSLPDGFQTNVGQLGDKLSGGQKQRIAIARMLLKNPDILLLDEPTSSLDNESSAGITNTLDQMSAGRTTVIVAHDIRSIRNAKHIIVLKDGKVEAEGSKDEVYSSSPTFRAYCDLQKAGV